MKKIVMEYQTLIKNIKYEAHRRKGLLLIALGTVVFTLSGCTEKNRTLENNSDIVDEIIIDDITENSDNDTTGTDIKADFSELNNLQFVFSSGAGAWSTLLSINSDGTFKGTYSDTDMGDADDDYPYGTVYLANFSGVFSSLEKVNDYTDKITIESIKVENEEETEEIKDGIRYIFSKPYGIADAKELYIYHKGAPIKELPEQFLNWVLYSDRGTTLPFVGLYNMEDESGFSSYELTNTNIDNDSEDLDTRLQLMEEIVDNLTKRIANDELTQMEYNQLTRDLYDTLDEQLNYVWNLLKETLEESSMEKLLEEQREWIKYKESEVKKEGEVYEGGSIRPMIENQKAAEITKIRLYELVELLKK